MKEKRKAPGSAATLTGAGAETALCGAAISYSYFTTAAAGRQAIEKAAGLL